MDVRSPKNKTPFRCIFQLDKECYKKTKTKTKTKIQNLSSTKEEAR